MKVWIAGRLVRAAFSETRDGLLLRADLWDWERLRYREGDRVELNADGRELVYTVRAVIRCPGGEAEVWAWLVESPAYAPDFLFDNSEPVTSA